jgi:hypothetical protein
MARLDVFTRIDGEELAGQSWDVHPEVTVDEVILTFPLGLSKYVVKIPNVELKDYCRRLEEAMGR